MKSCFLIKTMGTLMMVFVLCAAAEAGPSTSRSYKVSVTLPATFRSQAKKDLSMNIKNAQIAMEQDIRGNKTVMVKTVVPK